MFAIHKQLLKRPDVLFHVRNLVIEDILEGWRSVPDVLTLVGPFFETSTFNGYEDDEPDIDWE